MLEFFNVLTHPLRAVLFLVAVTLSSSILVSPSVMAQGQDQRCPPGEQTGTVEANGITIAYESSGPCTADTVVLIGGTGEQLVEWPTELVQALVQRGYRVLRFDNRDVGLSTHLTEAGVPDAAAITRALQSGAPLPLPYTLRDMANDTIGLLDALQIERATLVGASMGGNIAQLVAIDHPERMVSLTTVGADSANPTLPVIANPAAFAAVPAVPTDGDRGAFVQYELATYEVLRSPAFPTPDAALRDQVQGSVKRAYDPAGLVRQQTAALVDHLAPNGYRRTNLPRITVPTAIVQGADDPLQPVASAQDLAQIIPGSRLFVIPGLGHDMPAQLAPLFIAAIPQPSTDAAPGA